MVNTRSAPGPTPARLNRTPRPSDRHRTGTRSLSRVTEGDTEEDAEIPTRRAATSIRSSSALPKHSHRRTRSTTLTAIPNVGDVHHSPKSKRARLRPSLAGPQIHEMDIETRAQVLIPIAEDCIIQLLKAGLSGSLYRPGSNASWQLAWDSLQTQRRNKLFSPDSLPFNDFDDVREAFHSTVRANINTASLERAIHLSNLATFIWVILQPDEAYMLLPDEAHSYRPTGRRGVSTGPPGSGVEDSQDIVNMVGRRNRVLRMAWKRFWKDVIPRNMRSNKSAIELWADLSMQIMMSYGSTTVDGMPSGSSPNLPRPDPEISAELFAASAISQHGQWTIGEQGSSRDVADKEKAHRKWAKTANQRKTDLRDLKDEVLLAKYVYDDFRRGILGFIDGEILHTLISQSISPRKPDLVELAPSQEPFEDEHFSSSEERAVEKSSDTSGLQETTTSPDGNNNVEMELDLDIDLLNQILDEEMDVEESIGAGPGDEFPSEINSESDTPAKGSNATPEAGMRHQLKGDVVQASDKRKQDSAEWTIKHSSGTRPITMTAERSFHFAAPQATAERVEWESQSQAPTPTRKPRGTRTPLFLPTEGLESEGSRSASATPRPTGKIMLQPQLPGQSGALRPAPGQEDVEDPMPATSELGGPISSSLHPSLSPSPVRNGDLHIDNMTVNDVAITDGAASDLVGVPVTAATVFMHPPRSQRYLVDSRKHQQRNDGFASPDSSDSDDFALINPPPIHIPVPSQSTPLTSIAPVLAMSQNMPRPRPVRSRPSGASRDFIVVPPNLGPYTNKRKERAAMIGTIPSAQELASDGHVSPAPRPASVVSVRPSHRDAEAVYTPEQQYPDNLDGPASRHVSIASQAPQQSRIEASPTPQRNPSVVAAPRAGRRRHLHDEDPYLVDEDGSALEPDPAYTLPPGYQQAPSALHGRIGNQASTYSRIHGRRRKWTLEERLLLYRTVQKVPLHEPYPLRVVWYLHGENGVLSNDLEDFNTQHMKDKMVTIINGRSNNGFPIVGRARFWLPSEIRDGKPFLHADKEDFLNEVKQALMERREQERPTREAVLATIMTQREKKSRKGKKGKRGKKAKREDSPEESYELEDEEQAEAGPSRRANQAQPQEDGEDDDSDYEPERKTPYWRVKPNRQTRSARGAASTNQVTPQGATGEGTSDTIAPHDATPQDPPSPNADDEVGEKTPDHVIAPSGHRRSTSGPSTRQRLIPVVEIPTRRAGSRAPNLPVTATRLQAHSPVLGSESPVADETEAGETLYQGPPQSKMMRRSGPPVVPEESLSTIDSDEDEVDQDLDEGEFSETDLMRPEDGDLDIKPDMESLDAAAEPDLERERELNDDEHEANARAVHLALVRQKVLLG